MGCVYLMGWDADDLVWRKVLVNTAGKLIIDPSEIFENDPTDGEHGKAPDSDWAHDHAANASAHHIRYTDNESRTAIGDLLDSTGKFIKNLDCNYHVLGGISILQLKYSGTDNYYFDFYKTQGGTTLYLICTKVAVGNVAGNVKIWNGTVFVNLCTELIADSKIETHRLVADAHHTRYTAAEALMARGTSDKILYTSTYTSEDVAGVGLLVLDTTSGDIHLKGLAGGVDGQMIYCLKGSWTNNVYVYSESGDALPGNRFLTCDVLTNRIPSNSYASFWLLYRSGFWFVERYLGS